MAKKLKMYRTKKNLSQIQVANLIGVPPSTYRDWEYGKQIKGEPYIKIAEILGITVSELLGSKAFSAKELLDCLNDIEVRIKSLRKIVSAL